jgi:phosphoserine aminotransferase
MAVVFVRKDSLAGANPALGSFLRYQWHADNRSLGHTPPMFPIYLMGKVLRLMQAQGGIRGVEHAAARKAEVIYNVIDQSDGFYRSPVEQAHRSHMNVVFRLPDEDLEKEFLRRADDARLIGLKGHRSVGGLRASLYAALPMESVATLASFMEAFRNDH